MLFVWRGIGLVVPIVFFIMGFIVKIFIEDDRIGNPRFIGWTSFYSALVLLLVGLALFGGNKEAEEEQRPKKKHDFFFIPVIVWAIILGGLSAWLLISGSSSPENRTDDTASTTAPETIVSMRQINIFNSSSDTLTYIVLDETGLVERKNLSPFTYKVIELPAGYYLFSAFDLNKETTFTLPNEKYASDTTKYKMFKDEKGESYLQRAVYAPSNDSGVYDQAWLMIDGDHDLILLDVTSICNQDLSEARINATDWTKKVVQRYDGADMIELNLQPAKGGKVTFLNPGDPIPRTIEANEKVYSVTAVLRDVELSSEDYAKRLVKRLGN
jgi:hypothetical protein